MGEDMVRYLLSFVHYIARNLFLLLNSLIPKDDKTWVFMSLPDYADNSRALFEYLTRTKRDINYAWLCNSKGSCRILKQKGIQCYYFWSIRGLWTFLRSSVIFTTHNNALSLVSSKQCYVSLWHGFGIKAFGFKDRYDWRKFIKIEHIFQKISIFPVTSKFVAHVFSSSFHLPLSRFLVSGQPRLCLLTSNKYPGRDKDLLKKLGLKISADSILIVYLPTFRKSSLREDGISLLEFMSLSLDQLKHLDKTLCELNAVLVVKLHPLEENLLHSHYSYLGNFKNIRIINSKKLSERLVDLYDILRISDILVTDYSSVYFDYLLLDKPIIFFPFDYNNYLISRDLALYPYEKWTPGFKVYTFEELKLAIWSVIYGDDPKWIRKHNILREHIKKYIFETADINNEICETILKEVFRCTKIRYN